MLTLHIAEVLLALIFITGGVSTLRQPEARVAQIARFRFPLAQWSVRVNAIGMIVAGLFLLAGRKHRRQRLLLRYMRPYFLAS